MGLPLYQCHKQVRACKIARVHVSQGVDEDEFFLIPEDVNLMPIEVDVDFFDKHRPKAGGYYIVYADGHESFSPAEVFEAGYSLIPEAEDAEDTQILNPS
jgi:hypothetical protein